MADEGRRPWCYDFIFQIVQLLHWISPLPKSIAKTRPHGLCGAFGAYGISSSQQLPDILFSEGNLLPPLTTRQGTLIT